MALDREKSYFQIFILTDQQHMYRKHDRTYSMKGHNEKHISPYTD